MITQRSPRLPLEGHIDLTYRCNNNCRHCWLWVADNPGQQKKELTLKEIRSLADEARALGCQRWSISGGEPLLRTDFPEIFDCLTRKAVSYSLNTNGALITPRIARLLKRGGDKMVALYGATRKVHDGITRTPGSFDACMRGIAYLREAGAGFTVQIIPMRYNFHQYQQMVRLAEKLSPSWRIGAAWLFMSACGAKGKSEEIKKQRLSPREVVHVDPPNPGYESIFQSGRCDLTGNPSGDVDDRIFAHCIAHRRSFHVDPYGTVSFCSFIKDLGLRYDLRQGTFREAWESFIPALADRVRGGEEYRKNCGSCVKRRDCRWCAAYAYLEYRRLTAPIPYLCEIASETRLYKKDWIASHRRYYDIAGITIQVDCDLPISDSIYEPKFKLFQKLQPGKDVVHLRIHFDIPDLQGKTLGREIYRKPPWAIYRHRDSWIYLGISTRRNNPAIHRLVVFNKGHDRADIYMDRPELFLKSTHHSLTLFPTDQILLARLLADRRGFTLHAAGMKIAGVGLLFIGHSTAGKSTTVMLLKDEGEILCDENMIVRRWEDGFYIHGTWSHGDVTMVSNGQAPLRGMFFLEKARENSLEPFTDKLEVTRRLLPRVLKPLVTADWWDKNLATLEALVREVPAYHMKFDKSGRIKYVIRDWLKMSQGVNGGVVAKKGGRNKK